jgi:hypothetical protein
MFDAHKNSTGMDYAPTVALLVASLSPAILVVSAPVAYLSVSLAVICSLLCLTAAWINLRRSSQLFMPSIGIQKER